MRRILGHAASGLLILEFSMAGVTMIPVMKVAVDRFDKLTRSSPSHPVIILIGVLDLLAVAGAIAGFRRPAWALAAGGWIALLSGGILYRQLSHGARGSELISYSLFLTAALVMIAARAPLPGRSADSAESAESVSGAGSTGSAGGATSSGSAGRPGPAISAGRRG